MQYVCCIGELFDKFSMEWFQYLSLWFHDLMKLVITCMNKDHRDRPRDFPGLLEGNLLWKVVQSAFNSTCFEDHANQQSPPVVSSLLRQVDALTSAGITEGLQGNLSGPLEIYCIRTRLSPPWASRKSQKLSNGGGCHQDNLCSNSRFICIKMVSNSDTDCLCLSCKKFRNLLPDRN